MTTSNQLIERMCSEYLEMPGLRLTLPQAQRLWGLDEHTCRDLLGALTDLGFLRRTADEMFARASDGPAPLGQLQAAGVATR